jgi:tRNA wybutosine-synthesizing protein 2
VKINEKLIRYRLDIADVLLEQYPRCSSVVQIHGIGGESRKPRAELLRGDSSKTVHTENGVRFSLDVLLTMFSMGNHAERLRMATIGRGEVVVDMFAGVGQFCLPVSVHSGVDMVYACEINSNTFSHLLHGIRLNGVQEILKPQLGDCRIVAPRGLADRVIMGYLHGTHEYLDVAIQVLKETGGVIHYHEAVPQALLPERPLQRLRHAAEFQGKEMRILDWRVIKKYSPGVLHAVFDVLFEP